jgi:hypothetical protein
MSIVSSGGARGNVGQWPRAVDIHFPVKVGVIKMLWGADIFINNIPVLKTIVFCNVVVWIILFL